MITCAHCHKQIARTNPQYCCRCGYRIIQAQTISANPVLVTAAPPPYGSGTSGLASTTTGPGNEPSGTISEQFDQLMQGLNPQQRQYFLDVAAKKIADIKKERADTSQAGFNNVVPRKPPSEFQMQAVVPSPPPEGPDTLGLLALVAEDELTGRNRISR